MKIESEAQVLAPDAMKIESEVLPLMPPDAMDDVSLEEALRLAGEGSREHKAGNYCKALKFLNQALSVVEHILPESLEVAVLLTAIGIILFESGSSCEGFECHCRALQIRTSISPHSLEVAQSIFYLGELMRGRGQYEDALLYHKRALELRSRLQPLSLDQADSFHAIGMVLLEMGNWQEALNYFSREFINRNVEEAATARVHNCIGNILLRHTDRVADAVSNQRMAVAIQTNYGKSEILKKYIADLTCAVNKQGERKLAE